MKKILQLCLLLVFAVTMVGTSWAQERTITGKVTSAEDGSALPGVNVVLKGTTNGTITDVDGNYTLSVPSGGGGGGYLLVFSFIGLETQEIEIGARSVVDLAMSADVTELSEVVVTALGIEREARSVGYGIDAIESEELVKARETNIVNAMQGKVTGVMISNTSGNLGSSAKITIRGVTSLSGKNSPLWVVDGIPINDSQTSSGSRISGNRDFANGASVINPDDVETMNILKGAAATALYGSRAAAGVIVVTTKKGKANSDGSPQISINSSVRFDKLMVIPDYQQEYAMGTLTKYDSSNVGYDWGPKIVGQTVKYLPVTGKEGKLKAVKDNGVNDFFETGVSLINNISFSDANDKANYRLSLTSLNQKGVVPASELDRLTLGLNTGFKHSEKLKSGFGIQYIKTNSKGTAAAGANDPNIISLSSFSSTLDQKLFKPWIDKSGNQINQVEETQNNPYWIRNENKNNRDWKRFLGNFYLEFSPIKNLTLSGKVGYDYGVDDRFFSNRKGTALRINGNYRVDGIQRTQLNFDGIASYKFDLNTDLSLSILAGYNYNGRTFKREILVGNDLSVPELFSPGNVLQKVPTRDFSERRLMGVYSQAELSYKRWATLTLTARNDWSSTLPKKNNSYFYPSVSTAVVITEALGLSSRALSYAKVRASFAKVGNDASPYSLAFSYLPRTRATGQYSLHINFPFNGQLGYSKSSRIPNENLLPEEQTSYEFGSDMQFLDGRIGLDVTYFKSSNVNQILDLPIPESTGASFKVVNVGKIDTEGIEVSLNADVLKIGDFVWNSTVNFTRTESTVVELSGKKDERVIIASAFSSVQVVATRGKEFQLFAVPFLRDSATQKILIDPKTGRRQAGKARTFGSVLPDFTMGFVNNFSYKGLSLSFTVDWRSGGVMKSSTVENLQTSGLVKETTLNRGGTFIDKGGVIKNPDGTLRENDVPLQNAQDFWTSIDNSSISEPWIFDASFVKLREVAISYRLPDKFFQNNFIRSVQVGVEGRNLALLYSKVPHIDPESNLFGSGADGFGVERNNIPSTRSVGFNVKINF